MNKEYYLAIDEIDNAVFELKNILASTDCKGTDNEEAHNTIENLIEKLEDAKDYLNYLKADTKEGTLLKDSTRGKYYIAYDDSTESHPLSCGNSLELFLNDEWIVGRVEANSKGQYYFYGENRPLLANGMRARKRIL